MRKLTILGGAAVAMLLLPGMSIAQSPITHPGHASERHSRLQADRNFGPHTRGTTGSRSHLVTHDELARQNLVSGSTGAATAAGNASASGNTPGSTSGSGTKTIDGHAVVGTRQLTATAYAPTLQDNYPYGPVDYYGNPLVVGDVAVDPSVIPLGTLLWVTGYSSPDLPAGGFLARAVDTGGAIQGDRIDIFINASESEVSHFGIQQVRAYVLGN